MLPLAGIRAYTLSFASAYSAPPIRCQRSSQAPDVAGEVVGWCPDRRAVRLPGQPPSQPTNTARRADPVLPGPESQQSRIGHRRPRRRHLGPHGPERRRRSLPWWDTSSRVAALPAEPVGHPHPGPLGLRAHSSPRLGPLAGVHPDLSPLDSSAAVRTARSHTAPPFPSPPNRRAGPSFCGPPPPAAARPQPHDTLIG